MDQSIKPSKQIPDTFIISTLHSSTIIVEIYIWEIIVSKNFFWEVFAKENNVRELIENLPILKENPNILALRNSSRFDLS
ncbi:25250_t:CDS:2 [Gigaspora margarita]|uniref:25250_t:CDS:1 n=1 Tax=Gigaspora margarita TaxID=4874 RepID=A0ABN7V005_GIGMA|nr:25250_t:CDS:2 [Gigaspora margarita]